MPNDSPDLTAGETSLKAKVAFLRGPDAYSPPVDTVTTTETHMSWVFFAGERVYKLKKPNRSEFADFSTLKRREAACRAEFRLNRRLAKDTYLGVVPLTWSAGGFAIGGTGRTVDWLVVMRRLDGRFILENKILEGRLQNSDIDHLSSCLTAFYRNATPSRLSPDHYVHDLKSSLTAYRQFLLKPALKLPQGLVRRIESIQTGFLTQYKPLFFKRCHQRLIVDAHGDLRTEHIWLGEPIQIMDCLEFNPRLRVLDALSEISFLDLECARLGAAWAGKRLRAGIFARLPKLEHGPLFHFYRSYHAILRARLAIAHLLHEHPRKQEKWRPLTLHYLALAFEDAEKLSGLVKKREDPSGPYFHAIARWSRPRAVRRR